MIGEGDTEMEAVLMRLKQCILPSETFSEDFLSDTGRRNLASQTVMNSAKKTVIA